MTRLHHRKATDRQRRLLQYCAEGLNIQLVKPLSRVEDLGTIFSSYQEKCEATAVRITQTESQKTVLVLVMLMMIGLKYGLWCCTYSIGSRLHRLYL